MGRLVWGIVAVVLALWLIGLVMNTIGGFIHLLLVIAIAAVIYNLITGRK